MFHIREEGDEIKWGFNIYPLKSAQLGFLFYGFGKVWWCRYNKRIRHFYFSLEAY